MDVTAIAELLLVLLDKEHTERQVSEPWEQYYARRVSEHFTP